MSSEMHDNALIGALEAMLFVTDEPVGTLDLAEMLEMDAPLVAQALTELQTQLEQQNRGIQLREVAGGWRLYTHPRYHELIEKYVISWDARKLSQAALETLAIVAYCQPITRAGVASVRGVNSDSSISSLLEKGLLREAGSANTPGNPMRYATTRAFLERFGLRTVSDLPELGQFAPDEQTRALICERLGATNEMLEQAQEQFTKEGEVPDIMQMSFLDEEEYLSDASMSSDIPSARDLLNTALANNFGLTEKIDLSQLHFEEDDEYHYHNRAYRIAKLGYSKRKRGSALAKISCALWCCEPPCK